MSIDERLFIILVAFAGLLLIAACQPGQLVDRASKAAEETATAIWATGQAALQDKATSGVATVQAVATEQADKVKTQVANGFETAQTDLQTRAVIAASAVAGTAPIVAGTLAAAGRQTAVPAAKTALAAAKATAVANELHKYEGDWGAVELGQEVKMRVVISEERLNQLFQAQQEANHSGEKKPLIREATLTFADQQVVVTGKVDPSWLEALDLEPNTVLSLKLQPQVVDGVLQVIVTEVSMGEAAVPEVIVAELNELQDEMVSLLRNTIFEVQQEVQSRIPATAYVPAVRLTDIEVDQGKITPGFIVRFS